MTDFTPWMIAALGLVLGLAHAVDPDHMLAVSTFVSRSRSLARAALMGLLWGIGHTVTLVFVGAAVLFLGLTIPPLIASYLRLLVGLTLVLLGSSLIWEYRRKKAHFHRHHHTGYEKPHFHLHFHRHTEKHDREHHGENGKPLIVGMLQGMGGSASVMVLVLTTTASPWIGTIYLLIFGLGIISGMLVLSLLIGGAVAILDRHSPVLLPKLRMLTGLMSISVGVTITLGLLPALW